MATSTVYAALEPAEVWRHFAAFNDIPRPSRQEAAARDYVLQVAWEYGAAAAEDSYGNVVVRVAASPGREADPVVVIQAHLDMVCEKRPGVEHDFATDPIRPRIEGDRVYATGTTLGADNGMGAALALATLTTPQLEHGPLELLFTVEEEIGLHGANELDPSLVQARLMINLDSEDPDELTVGCAGGSGAVFRLPISREPAPAGWRGLRVEVSGLKGGHSGVQIHERLANAIKLLLAALEELREAGVPYRLQAIAGGNAHNAIPRDASATLVVPPGQTDAVENCLGAFTAELTAEWHADEPGLHVSVVSLVGAGKVLSPANEASLVELLREIPHGVLQMSNLFPGKVETSENLATVRTEPESVVVATSTRSFIAAELERLQRELSELGRRTGAVVEARSAYPAWEPKADSGLLRIAERVYGEVFGRAPQVQVIHAGLECGIIAAKLPGMEAVSFGPLIQGAHTPEEFVDIPSVAAIWRLLTALLVAIGRER